MVWVGGKERERKNIKSVYKSVRHLCVCVYMYKSISCVQLILLTFTHPRFIFSLLRHLKP